MLELDQLRWKHFGRFVEEQCISFSSLANFVQVDGKNNNTGGSSGSGKSTVFMALDYLLGVNHRPATILQCRYTEEPLWVQGTFTEGGEKIIITRSKSLIQVEKGGEKFKGSRAEEIIDQIIRIPRELFRKIMHKRQREGGFFLNFTPKEMHDFLIDCIGLSPFKKHYEVLDIDLQKIHQNLEDYAGALMTDGSWLKATQEAILALGMAPIQDMHKEVILGLNTKYRNSELRFVDAQKRFELADREFSKNRPNFAHREYDAAPREAYEKRRKEIEADISACFEKERQRQEEVRRCLAEKRLTFARIVSRIADGARAKTEATKLAGEIMSIRAQLCPTCTQVWATESAIAKEKQKLEEVAGLKITILDGSNAENEKITLEKEIDDLVVLLNPVYDPLLPGLNDQLRDVTDQIIEEKRKAGVWYEDYNAEQKKQMDEFVSASNALRDRHAVLIEQSRGQMDVDRRVVEAAVAKLRAYDEAKQRYDKTFNELKAKEASYIEKTTQSRIKCDELEAKRIIAEEAAKAAKLFVSFSFDEALDAISDKATKIIRCIPNMKNATIQFEGTKENKDGRVKEEVNAVLSMDGEPTVPVKSLSGGEQSAIDLAIDLAVIDYIETRSGMGINVFILDEPFNGLGTVEIEMALDVLKNSNTKKKLIIVDHNPEVKQMVQTRLVVERTGLYSKVA